jgi:hypothetical protein
MKTKSAYRLPKNNIPAEEPADIPENIQPSASITINFETDKAEPAVVEEKQYYPEPGPEPDEATAALVRQLQHLRASEQAVREFGQRVAAQRAAQAAPAPTLPDEPEARIALWREHGLSDQDAAYLQERPQMVEFPMVTKAAYAATLQAGIERNSPAFAETMEGNFAALLRLSPAEQEIARAAGVSDATYAAGKLRMLRERASGERE